MNDSQRKAPPSGKEKKVRPDSKKGKRSILEIGREVVSLEIEGLQELLKHIGKEFTAAVRLILDCRGKVIVCGLGKSGIVARKIAGIARFLARTLEALP